MIPVPTNLAASRCFGSARAENRNGASRRWGVRQFAYDATGLMTRRLLGSDTAAYFAYDAAGRLADLKNAPLAGGDWSAFNTYFTYGRLAGGNIEKILREAGTGIYYEYDDADRLTKETWRDSGHSQVYCFAYDYDAAGNRTKEDKDGTSVYYYYDNANALTEKNKVGTGWTYFAYDENGSMLREYDQAAGTTTYYAYADNGLASRIKPPAGSSTYFHYDARMQRFAIDFGVTLAYFGWDGLNQLEERKSDLSLETQHTHGATPIEGIGSMVVTKHVYTPDRFEYPHYDHRGSLFFLEDTGFGYLDMEFNAFGEELYRFGDAFTRFGYQGTAWMRHDSGLYVSPTRLYVPGVGRFGQRDPWASLLRRPSFVYRALLNPRTGLPSLARIGLPGGPVLYAPVSGPVFIDPTGLWTKGWHKELTVKALDYVFKNRKEGRLWKLYEDAFVGANMATDDGYSIVDWAAYGFTPDEAIKHWLTGRGQTPEDAATAARRRERTYVALAEAAWGIGKAYLKRRKWEKGVTFCRLGWEFAGTATHTFQDKFAHASRRNGKWSPLTSSQHGGTLGEGGWTILALCTLKGGPVGFFAAAWYLTTEFAASWQRLDTRIGNPKRYGEAEMASKVLVAMSAYYAGGPVGCNCLDMPEG